MRSAGPGPARVGTASRLIADAGEQRFDLGALFGGEGNLGRPGAAAIVAVEVARGLDPVDAQLSGNALSGAGDSFLLLASQLRIVVFPRQVDLLASLRRAGGKSQN